MIWRWVRRLFVVALLVAGVVLARYTLFKPAVVPVTVFRVATGTVEETVTNSKAGSVETRRRASLSPELGGRVEMLAVREGQRVKRGDVLLRLVADEYRAQAALQARALEVARVTVTEACEASLLARREAERTRSLVESGLASPQQLDQLDTQRETAGALCGAARSRVEQAQAALHLARVMEGKTVLRAPFDGVAARVSTEVGEWITPAPTGIPIPPVIELISQDAIYVTAPLDEVDVAKVAVGMPVRVTMDAFPGRSFTGRLTRVAPFVDDQLEQNRTFDVEVEFDDHDVARTLLPGTSADVEVILQARTGVLRVPAYALTQGDRVLVVRDEALVATPVKVGLRNWDFAEIVGGLAEGDRVVTSLDRVEVKEGARVRVESETTR